MFDRFLWVFCFSSLPYIDVVNSVPCQPPSDCVNPCPRSMCQAYPSATCRPYYCNGRCEARFYVDNFRVQCTPTLASPTPPNGFVLQRVCPPLQQPLETTWCANMCYGCELRNQLCCPNGCGASCMTPAIIGVPTTPPPTTTATVAPIIRTRVATCPQVRPGTMGICIEACSNCEARNQLCCSNGCGNVCTDPVFVDLQPVQPVVKRGSCPKLLPNSVGICLEMLNCETECPARGKLCCSNGCGHVCMDPVYE